MRYRLTAPDTRSSKQSIGSSQASSSSSIPNLFGCLIYVRLTFIILVYTSCMSCNTGLSSDVDRTTIGFLII
nr:MAG TPA: hypothetical protein [Caudoviricetes sp.]